MTKPLSFFRRKHIAKLRLGSLEIRIESGRFARPRLEINERICLLCQESKIRQGLAPEIETESHFLLFCYRYDALRTEWLSKINKPDNFEVLDEGSKLCIILNLSENCKLTAGFITEAYGMRSRLLNNQ